MLFKISDKTRSTIIFRHFLLNILFFVYDFKIARPCAVKFRMFLTDGRCNLENIDPRTEVLLRGVNEFSFVSSSEVLCTVSVVILLSSSWEILNIQYVIPNI